MIQINNSRVLVYVCMLCSIFLVFAHAIGKYPDLEFLESCSKTDPNLENCLAKSINIFLEHLQIGLPQLGFNDVEPIIIDELHINLGDEPNGYKAQFKNIHARGVSSLRVTRLRTRLSDDEVQLQLILSIPKIRANANYTSTGTLILIKAGGSGNYWGDYENVKTKVFIRAKPYISEDRRFLSLQQLKLDFSVENIKMGVENIHDNNTILQAAMNLFINSNAQELMKEMKPDLKRKMAQVMSNFVEKLFARISYDAWIEE